MFKHLKKVLVLSYLGCQIYLIKYKNYFYPNGYVFDRNLTAIIAAMFLKIKKDRLGNLSMTWIIRVGATGFEPAT